MSGAREQVRRLLALTPYLQARDGVPLADVAADFGVSPAQLRKDLQVLWFCGLPGPGNLVDIDFEALEDDPNGLVRISNAEFLPRPLRLTGAEATALLVALRALREGSPRQTREVIDRLLARLGEAVGDPAPVEVHLPREPADRAVTREILEEAVAEDRQVQLDYYVPTRDETTSRVVDPLAVLTQDGKDYLDAWCHLAEDRRLFRLDRIDCAVRLDSPRESGALQPRDLAEGLFEAGSADRTVRLRVHPRARWVADYYPVLDTRDAPDGGLEVGLAVGDSRWLVRTVLGLAPDAEVIEPAEYADEVAAAARAALRLYGGGVG